MGTSLGGLLGMVRHIGLVILALSFVVVSGCHVGCCSKRASEKKCPTDIRKTHCWCFGEDALFRYPCGPNRVYYGHKATCWREWPSSGSEWRDAHCGPPLAPAMMPHEAEMMPVPPMTEPAPAEIRKSRPSSIESDALEPNTLPAVPQDGGIGEGVVPPQEVLPDQPMPQAPIPGDLFQPMSGANGEPAPRFESSPGFTDRGRTSTDAPKATARNVVLPAVAAAPARIVENTLPRSTGASSTPIIQSRWRLVVHDNPEGIAAGSRDNAPLFRPPSFGDNQTPAPQAEKPAPRRRSLEEQTGDALQRFMSFESRPGANR